MKARIVVGTLGCLALLSLVGCFYPPDTQPVASSNSGQPEELQLTAAESNQLRNLHQVALQKFLEVPDFGMSRMVRPPYQVPLDVMVPTVATTVVNQAQYPVALMAMHNGKNTTKLNLTKSLRIGPTNNLFTLDQLGMNFQQVQLMGIAKQPEPTMFDIQEDTPPEARPTRALDAFEQRGLAKLQANSTLYVETVQGQMRVLAPIYAGATCVSCHNKQGELLGAFSYTLASTGVKP